jgi:5'-nucleotidase
MFNCVSFNSASSGTIRSDAVYKAGDFTMGNLMDILPYEDVMVVILVSGEQILAALENGVSKVPATEGRFPAISGIKLKFSASVEPMHRVMGATIDDQPLDLNKMYKLATKIYMSKGKDGYDSLSGSEYLVNEEQGPMLSTLILNHMRALNIVTALKSSRDTVHALNVFHKLKFHTKRKSFACISPQIDGRITRVE